jgi:hypothetical protein
MATTLERLELLELRVEELEQEVHRLGAIVDGLKKPVTVAGERRDTPLESEALLNQHYPNRKPLLS